MVKLTLLAAICAALLLACGERGAFSFHPDRPVPAEVRSGQRRPDAALTLRQDMRKLWSDHVFWTRDYIIAALTDQGDKQAAASRLMKNQEDIGAAISTYYGAAGGEKLTSLLKDHITIAVAVINAAKADDKGRLRDEDAKWKSNAQDIADFLAAANPNWPKAALSEMMMTHLSTTTDELTARLSKDWDGDVKAFDRVYDHILKMADALSEGIVRQYPDRFSEGGGGR